MENQKYVTVNFSLSVVEVENFRAEKIKFCEQNLAAAPGSLLYPDSEINWNNRLRKWQTASLEKLAWYMMFDATFCYHAENGD